MSNRFWAPILIAGMLWSIACPVTHPTKPPKNHISQTDASAPTPSIGGHCWDGRSIDDICPMQIGETVHSGVAQGHHLIAAPRCAVACPLHIRGYPIAGAGCCRDCLHVRMRIAVPHQVRGYPIAGAGCCRDRLQVLQSIAVPHQVRGYPIAGAGCCRDRLQVLQSIAVPRQVRGHPIAGRWLPL